MSQVSQVNLCNLALGKMGAQPITSINDLTSQSAIACNNFFQQTFLEVARSHPWNCLKRRQVLAQLPASVNPPVDPNTTPAPSTPWAPFTVYTAAQFVTYGLYYYQCLVGYTSTNNFINDLTAGYWFQSDIATYQSAYATSGSGTLFGWAYGYALPADYILVTALNGNSVDDYEALSDEYDIYIVQSTNGSNQLALFTDQATADVEYVANITDITMWDPLFSAAFVCLLASYLSTALRKDDGKLYNLLREQYTRDYLPKARVKDAGEKKPRRYYPVSESRFVLSRWNSTNS
jgi:hypothetical protein